MLKFWTKNSKHFKFAIGSLLGLLMLLAFAIYYIADKGATGASFDSTVKLLQTNTDVATGAVNKTVHAMTVSGAVPANIAKHAFNHALLKSLLTFAILTIPLVIAQLSLGSKDNFIVSLTINIISTVVVLILFALIIAAGQELNALSIQTQESNDLYAAQKQALLNSKMTDFLKAINDQVIAAKKGITEVWTLA